MGSDAARFDPNNTRSLVGVNSNNETRLVHVDDLGNVSVTDQTFSGTMNVYRSLDLDETEEEVNSGSCVLAGYFMSNRAGSERSIKFYEGNIGAVVVGTTVPKLTIVLAAGQACNLTDLKIQFNGLCIAATTGFTDTDTGAPGTNDVIVNIFTRI